MKISYPERGWAEVSFSTEEYDDFVASRQIAFDRLTAMPGVKSWKVDERVTLKLPTNVMDTAVWNVFSTGLPFPVGSAIDPHIDFDHAWTPGFVPTRPLFRHQESAVSFLQIHEGGLLADTMGLGKTASAITAAENLAQSENSLRPRLIIGPKYTRAVWLRELLALGAIKDESEFEYGAGRDPHADFNFDAKYWFVHYDVAYAWANRLSVTPRGQRGRPIVAILDECHWLRNPKAQRTKGATALALLAPHRILLTGTPLANRPSELHQLLTILDGRAWGPRHDFRVRYCGAMTTEHGFADGSPTNVEELQQRMSGRYLRRELDSAGVELPPMRRSTLLTDLNEEETSAHADIVRKIGGVQELLHAVLERRAGRATLPLISKLRKITSDAKLKSTIDYASDVLESGQSCVIFCWQRETVVQLQRALLAAKVTCDGQQIYAVTGEMDQDDRDEIVDRFQANGGALISTLDCLKEGVTLTRATHVIIHDLSWVPVEVLQGEARIYRIGQKLPVTAVWCLASNSIDELLARVVSEKAKTMKTVMKINTAEDAVAELQLPAFLGATAEHDFSALFKAIGIEQ